MNSNTNPSPPTISLTPTNLDASVHDPNIDTNGNKLRNTNSNETMLGSGSNRARSRAGTLPSSFLNSNLSIPTSRPGTSNSASNSTSTSPLMTTTSHPNDFFNDFMDNSSTNNPTPNVNASSAGSRRMRSGSLFSTNSIWNDDNVSLHSQSLLDSTLPPNANGTPNSFISPTLGAQPSTLALHNSNEQDSSHSLGIPIGAPGDNDNDYNSNVNNMINRNRSYTTNAAIPVSGFNPAVDAGGYSGNRLSTSPFVPNYGNGNNSDINALLDSLINNGASGSPNTRNRAQTFSGIAPAIPEDFINTQQHMMSKLQQAQAQAQAQVQAQAQAQMNVQHQHQHQQYPQYSSQISLVDDSDLSQIVVTNSFENPNLGPTNWLLFDNLPMFFTSQKLYAVLINSFGNSSRNVPHVLNIRTTTTSTSKLSLVECSSIEVAMNIKAGFNHFEIAPGAVLYIAFAKCRDVTQPSANGAISPNPNGQPVPISQPVPTTSPPHRSSVSGHSSNSSRSPKGEVATGSFLEPKIVPTDLENKKGPLLNTINQIIGTGANNIDMEKIHCTIDKSLSYDNGNYRDDFGPLPDPIPIRQFDAPMLRELRKLLEYNESIVANGRQLPEKDIEVGSYDDTNRIMSQIELEDLCLAMLDELPELCYDYIGNTIVQKLFTLVKSPLIKLMMVKEITPFLTQLSIHKNGTWAIQKIINLCFNDYQQKHLIGVSLKPYTVKLFNDQFGNYVLQGCIKFGSPYNDFIFESILDNFIEISFGRFGSRSIRTILETSNERFICKEQILLVSGLIIQYANELVVNSNGSLLITWLLDTFNGFGTRFEKKYELLTNKFIDNLDVLCCHKLSNLTILKILNNRQDLRSKRLIMDKIFGTYEDSPNDDQLIKPPSKLLETILSENLDSNFNAGPLFIYKILYNPLLLNLTSHADDKDSGKSSRYQKFITQQIRRLLLELNITNPQPYKKLMDEVGLSNTRMTRSSSLSKRGGGNGTNGSSGHINNHNHNHNQHQGHNHNHKRGGMRNSNTNTYGNMGQMNGPNINMPYAGMAFMQPGMVVPPQAGQTNNGYQPPPPPGPASYPPQNYQMMPPMNQPYAPAGGAQVPPPPPPQHVVNPENMTTPPQTQQEFAAMQQLEQLSLSSAAMGYASNPSTPSEARPRKKNSFFG